MSCLPFREPALLVLSQFAIAMSVLRFIMASDYPFGIFKFSYLRVCHRSATQWVSPVEQELVTLPGKLSSPPDFSTNRVAQYWALCVMFCISPLSFFLWPSTYPSTTKTGHHDIAEILLKMALNTKNQINHRITASNYPFGIFRLVL